MVALPMKPKRSSRDGVYKRVACNVRSYVGDVAQSIGPSRIALARVGVLPNRPSELSCVTIVKHIRPKIVFLVVAFIQAQRKETPPILLFHHKVFQGCNEN